MGCPPLGQEALLKESLGDVHLWVSTARVGPKQHLCHTRKNLSRNACPPGAAPGGLPT